MHYYTLLLHYVIHVNPTKLQEFSPGDTQQYADLAYDALFTTDLTKPFTLVNGCEVTAMTVEAGQWTRLHILNVGHQYNSILTIESVVAGAAQCDVGLLSKVRSVRVYTHAYMSNKVEK
jgi:hypothetical protein